MRRFRGLPRETVEFQNAKTKKLIRFICDWIQQTRNQTYTDSEMAEFFGFDKATFSRAKNGTLASISVWDFIRWHHLGIPLNEVINILISDNEVHNA